MERKRNGSGFVCVIQCNLGWKTAPISHKRRKSMNHFIIFIFLVLNMELFYFRIDVSWYLSIFDVANVCSKFMARGNPCQKMQKYILLSIKKRSINYKNGSSSNARRTKSLLGLLVYGGKWLLQKGWTEKLTKPAMTA